MRDPSARPQITSGSALEKAGRRNPPRRGGPATCAGILVLGLLLPAAPAYCQDSAAPQQPASASKRPVTGNSAVAAPATARPPESAGKPSRPEPVTPELSPYKVLVELHVAPGAVLTHAMRDALRRQLQVELNAAVAQMWNLEVQPAAGGPLAASSPLERLTADELTGRYAATELDKVFLVRLSQSGSRYRAAVREWDAASQTLGAVHSSAAFDDRLLPAMMSELVVAAFRPIAVIGSVQGQSVEMLVRAGEYPPARAEAVPFRTGTLLQPFVRYYDRDRKLQQIRQLPWTFLQVEDVERGRMTGRLVSAYRSPLAGSRRRMEVLAIVARPSGESTRLIIAPQGDASNPLAGCRVEVLNRLPTADDPVADREERLTDARGGIVLQADPAHPLQHVIVHSGKAILARVPLIPGLEPELTLVVPDDSARLAVEGGLSVLEGELIDAVSRRSVLMARARRAAKARKWDDVDAFLEELKSVPDYDAIRQKLQAIELPALQAARDRKDRVAESRIRKMCADFQQVAAAHLDPEKLREFRAEMAELRSAVQ